MSNPDSRLQRFLARHRPLPNPVDWYIIITIVICLLFLLDALARAQTVKSGQTVYVVAVKSSGQLDISTENKLKEEFQKQKAFKVVTSLQSADLVFLMVVEYEYNQAYVGGIGMGSEDIKSVAAFVVAPTVYTEHKADLDTLRDKALWQVTQNNNAWRTGGLPKKIVKKFHEAVKGKS